MQQAAGQCNWKFVSNILNYYMYYRVIQQKYLTYSKSYFRRLSVVSIKNILIIFDISNKNIKKFSTSKMFSTSFDKFRQVSTRLNYIKLDQTRSN